MKRLASPGAAIMVHRIAHFARNVLHQRSVPMNVQELRAIADGQYRLTVYQRVIEQPAIGLIAPFVRICILYVRRAAKSTRLNVRGAAREYEAIERLG